MIITKCYSCSLILIEDKELESGYCYHCELEKESNSLWALMPDTRKAKIIHYWLGVVSGKMNHKWVKKTLEDQKDCNFLDIPLKTIMYYKNNI